MGSRSEFAARAGIAEAGADVDGLGGSYCIGGDCPGADVEANLSNEALAVQALLRGPEGLGLHSGQASEIRAWVKAGTGIDLPEQMRSSGTVQLYGARMVRKGVPTAEISYRVGDMDVALVVSKLGTGEDVRHSVVAMGSDQGAKYQSWVMHGQRYTVAAADARAACFLCHAGGAPAARATDPQVN